MSERPNFIKIKYRMYLVNTQAGFNQALYDFTSDRRSSHGEIRRDFQSDFPKVYPSLVVFGWEYAGYHYVTSSVINTSDLISHINANDFARWSKSKEDNENKKTDESVKWITLNNDIIIPDSTTEFIVTNFDNDHEPSLNCITFSQEHANQSKYHNFWSNVFKFKWYPLVSGNNTEELTGRLIEHINKYTTKETLSSYGKAVTYIASRLMYNGNDLGDFSKYYDDFESLVIDMEL